MNREMLKECIADAKTIRETAIASAKVALEEAFTPQLTAMFAEKLNELEMEEEMKEESVDEMYSMEEEGLEEDFNLEELLAELSKEDNEDSEMKKEGMEQELDEDLMLEDMSDEEIEELVMQVIDDMIASGKLMPGEGEEEGEEEDMEDMEDMGGEEDIEAEEEIDIDEILAEMESEEELEEGLWDKVKKFVGGKVGEAESAFMKQHEADFQALKTAEKSNDKEAIKQLQTKLTNALNSFKPSQFGVEGSDISLVLKNLKDVITNVDPNDERSLLQKLATGAGEGREKVIGEDTISELEEAYTAIAELRKELNEVNLLNAKLLYTNKIFKAKNLTESEKIKVLNTFDKAETVKEVKLVFETLTETFKATTAKKNPIKESLGSASKTIGTATPKQPIIEANEAFARMQRLAGLKK
jgi:hypothetical protein